MPNDTTTINDDQKPVGGNVLSFPSTYQKRDLKETLLTAGAVLFIVLGVWSVYRHRVEVRLGYDPKQIGIAYNLSAAEAAHISPEERQRNLQKLSERLELLRGKAEKLDQLSGYKVMSRRLDRLQAIVNGDASEISEQLYIGRRIAEFQQDLSVLEEDFQAGPSDAMSPTSSHKS